MLFFFLGPGDFAWAKDLLHGEAAVSRVKIYIICLDPGDFCDFQCLTNTQMLDDFWDSPGGLVAASQQSGEIAILR